MDWFKISDTPGTDYTRVTVDVPHEQLTDVIDAIRACGVERGHHRGAVSGDSDSHGGFSSGRGRGAGEGAPEAVISVAVSVPRGGSRADMGWPAPHITTLDIGDLIAETAAGLRAALAEEAEGGEAR